MDNPIVISLLVSGIGMLMLFLALALLYGLMYLMTALVKDRPDGEAEEQRGRGVEERRSGGTEGQGGRGAEGQKDRGARKQAAMRRRVAVIGIALARAELELSSAGLPEIEARPSPWQQYHRHRLLNPHT